MRIAVILLIAALGPVAAPAQPKWWLDQPVRLIQTNLREIDARDFDVDVYAAKAREFGANTVLINVGGIVANYPTGLEFHYRNPHLQGDLIGDVVARLHADGIRVIGRFDFSKINEKLAARKPEWLYRSLKGEPVNYNGQVHTCVNGGYQQEYLFRILGEAIDRYPLDGIFFNMIGYQVRDYSQNYHGICQSDACRRRFKEWSGGLDLPVKEDPDDPVFRRYAEFRRVTSDELFVRVQEFIKSRRPGVAICTYTHAGVDLVRQESGSEIYSERPAWNYHSTENVRRFLGGFRDRQVANTAVHFPDIPFRHSSVAPHLTGMRLIENILAGGILDYYVIGRLDNQEDRLVLPVVRDIYRFHESHERWFTGLRSDAEVLLVRGPTQEFRGLVRILAEQHIDFDVMDSWRLEHRDTPKSVEDYRLIILPGVASLSEAACRRLDDYVAGGGKVFATGETATRDEIGNPQNRFRLRSAGVEESFRVHGRSRGAYFRVRDEDKRTLAGFEELDILYLWGDFLEFKLRPGAAGYLGWIPAAMYGPPEKCYYTEVTGVPGLIANRHGKGRFAYLPWPVGAQYEHRSHHGHAMLAGAVIRDVLDYRSTVTTDAPPLVEIARHSARDQSFRWIGLANHSGQLGTGFHAPLPIRGITLSLQPERPIRSARALRLGIPLPVVEDTGGRVRLTVPELRDFEIVVME